MSVTQLCVCVALGIQHAMCMRHIVINGLSRSTDFRTLSLKRYDFRKNVIERKMSSLQLLSETFLVLRRTDRIKNVYWSSCKVLVILVGF
jgi:hypothetical protein